MAGECIKFIQANPNNWKPLRGFCGSQIEFAARMFGCSVDI